MELFSKEITQSNYGKQNIKKSMSFEKLCIAIVILTASFDIFLTFDIGGFTFRIAQIFLMLLVALFACRVVKSMKIKVPSGGVALFVWVVLQGVFINNSPNFSNAIGYFFWLLLDVCIIFVFIHYFTTPDKVQWLLRIYVDSFCLLSIVGLVQLLLGFWKVDFYVAQWWKPYLPRLNGFSYEPSYYATYLICGWVLVMYLLEKGSVIFTKNELRVRAGLITVALFMSTSRMGWLVMVLYIAIRLLMHVSYLFRGKVSRNGLIKILLYSVLGLLGVAIVVLMFSKMDFSFLLSGLGIGGTSAHSSETRINDMLRAFEIFKDSPWVGYSLGGVDPAIAEKFNLVFRNGLAQCVWVEILAASGIIGAVFFLTWIYKTVRCLFVHRNETIYSSEAMGLIWALFMECVILAFNQNILRIYFWVIIAIINVVSKSSTYGKEGI